MHDSFANDAKAAVRATGRQKFQQQAKYPGKPLSRMQSEPERGAMWNKDVHPEPLSSGI